jgi:hypothetical protein
MRRTLPLLAAALGLWAAPAGATDTWTAVRPGVDWLHRVTGGGTPQDVHAVRIDLSRGDVGLRASMNAPGSERGVGTDTFAANVGALVAIDGDWSNGFTPVGLAIGNGFLWHDHYSNPNIGSRWGTFGCDVWNRCTMEALPPLPDLWGYSPTIAPRRYYNAVGTNGLQLLQDGVRTAGCYDGCPGDTCRHPRSALCLEQDGTHLWFVAIDGRRSGASGMTCGEVRDLAQDLGCWDAAMLDGGGSTALWVNGAIRNVPSDGSPRNVANSIGVVYADVPDAICPFPAGAWCDGSVLRTCNGGRLVNEGDCGAFGTACQEDGDWAFCVNPLCPGGDGTGTACADATHIESCTDGVYSSGDCGVFGLACGSDDGGASCMDPRCVAGPNSGFCAGDALAARCEGGVYAEEDCATAGWTCWEGGGASVCVDPLCPDGPDSSSCVDPDTVGACVAGVYDEVRCELGQGCATGDGGAACVDLADDDDSGDDDDSAPDDDDSGDDDGIDLPSPGDAGPEPAGCGCDGAAGGGALLLPLAVLGRRRRAGPPEPRRG